MAGFGLGGGGVPEGASASGAPHSLQNFADGPDAWPQRGQMRDIGDPHVSQKRAAAGLSNPQCAQRIRSLS
ncbi:hypothetical protein WT33_31080 [Burkholderia stagnalis]|nr:hypothetical protein WT33_31080 [Burkholderia stagnalis]